ncbi:MAG: hypothetical protein AAFW83_03585 [Pseudomonadota bacterium]
MSTPVTPRQSLPLPVRRVRQLVLSLFAATALAACSTITPYQAADGGRYGYSEQQIESNKFRIVFSGNTLTDLSTVENYVLLRAAELTLATGDDYFITLGASTDVDRSFRSNGTVFGGAGFGRPGFFYGGFGGFGGGFGNTATTTRERQAYTIGTIIETFKGTKPAGVGTAYDARSVVSNIGPSVARPQ